jgi:hypothetical protein
MFRCPCGGLFLPEPSGTWAEPVDAAVIESDDTPVVWACPRCARVRIFETGFSIERAHDWFVSRSSYAVN